VGKDFQGFRVAARLVIKHAKLHAQVVAPRRQVRIFFQFAQAPGRRFTETVPELITLKQQTRVVRLGGKRAVIGRARLRRLVQNVEVTDAEVPPDNGKIRIQTR